MAASHWLVQLAQAFFTISYIQWNQLYLRICIVAAQTCIFLFGLIVLPYSVDTMVWSGSQILITLIHIFLIFFKMHKVRFEQHYDQLYTNVFKDVMNRWEFKLLKDNCITRERARVDGTQIIKAGNPFDDLIIVADLEASNSHLELLRVTNSEGEEEVLVERMGNWSWVGVVEYVTMYESGLKRKVTFREDGNGLDYGVTLNTKKAGRGAVYYRVNVKNLLKLYQNKTHGLSIKNAILARMLGAVSHTVVQTQFSYAKLMKKIVRGARHHTKRENSTENAIQLEIIETNRPLNSQGSESSSSDHVSDPAISSEESIDNLR
ncbi:unnamed protein product [Blepharisma stoltei]|uniref:POPDC1-3 domain-containing protein n=1 Tax=Blepharisma stoltei TaxID=1481888 RepID=A0AAU9IU74_9CILI|nr:unnamed protein product [Blepharisma stoltei]